MSRGTITSMLMLTFLLSIGCQTNQRSRSSAYRSSGNYTAKQYSQKNSSTQMATRKQSSKRRSEVVNQDAPDIKPQAPQVLASRRAEEAKPVLRSEAQESPRYSEIFLPPSPSTQSRDSHNSNSSSSEMKINTEYVPPAAPGIRSPVIKK